MSKYQVRVVLDYRTITFTMPTEALATDLAWSAVRDGARAPEENGAVTYYPAYRVDHVEVKELP
jgi:hypothetical protein